MTPYPCPNCGHSLDKDLREVECPNCLADLTRVVSEQPPEELDLDAPPPPPAAAAPAAAATVAAPAGLCALCGNPTDGSGACSTPGCTAAPPVSPPPVSPPPPPPEEAELPPPPPTVPPPPPPTGQVRCARCGTPGGQKVCPDCATLPVPTLVLQVEGHETVRWRGRQVTRVAITADETLIGRRDVMSGIYPDVDLRDYYDRKEGYVARRHVQVMRERGKHYLIDLAGDDRTAFAEKAGAEPRVLNLNDRIELAPGNRVVVGLVVGLTVTEPEA